MGNRTVVGVVKKGLMLPLRSSYMSACHHPMLLAMAAVLLLTRRFLPSIFNLLVSVSPVLVLTFLLLAVLLSFSEPNNPASKRRLGDNCTVLIAGGGVAHRRCKERRKRIGFVEGRDLDRSSSSRDPIASDSHCRGSKKVLMLGGSDDVLREEEWEIAEVQHVRSKKLIDTDSEIENGDLIPVIDELHPLLEDRNPLCVAVPDTEASSVGSSPEHTSDEEGEADEDEDEDEEEEEEDGDETENQNDEEETRKEEEDGIESVLKWTADDEKNLRDLGTSEIERNQRLEHLIAKRRSRIYQRSETEKNLIDLGSNDPSSVVEELSRLLVMIPPRKNPFDIPYPPDDPAPGSAPSVLLPRRNPFDLPGEETQGSPAATFDLDDGAAPLPHRDVFFCRHESFAIGTASMPFERRESRFKPYFAVGGGGVAEQISNPSTDEPIVRARKSVSRWKYFTAKVMNKEGCSSTGGETTDEKGSSSSSSSYSEAYDDDDDASEDSDHFAPPQGDSPAGSHDSTKSIVDDLSRVVAENNGKPHIAEPLYDSSPSAASFEEASLDPEKTDSDSSSSEEEEEEDDEQTPGEAESGDDYANGRQWVASSSLSAVDREESEAKEVMEISEDDVMQIGISLAPPASPQLLPVRKLRSGKGFLSRIALVTDGFRTFLTPEELVPPPSPPSTFGVAESRVSILPSIPEEIVEDLRHEEGDPA